jgi:hypothetical protein
VLGRARLLTDDTEKLTALEAIVEHVVPGRWADARRPTQKELNGTLVLELPLDEASAKIRVGPPSDFDEDLELTVWAGVIPLALTAGEPEPDPVLTAATPLPPYLSRTPNESA